MTNRERYKQAFSALPSPRKFDLEVGDMIKMQKKQRKNIAVAAAAACAVIIGGSATAYAADIGGIQEKISVWIFGKETETVMTPTGTGAYSFSYNKDDGSSDSFNYGIAEFDAEGNMTWRPVDDVVSSINETAMVNVDENGRVWVYYYDQKEDITDSFDEYGICNVTLTHEEKPLYVKVIKNDDGNYTYTQTDDPDKEPINYATSTVISN